jgi:hypothetical protein
MTATLSAADLEAVTTALVRQLMEQHSESLQLLTTAQVCGLFNLDAQTVKTLPIPKVTIKPGKHRYRAADVAAFIADRTA